MLTKRKNKEREILEELLLNDPETVAHNLNLTTYHVKFIRRKYQAFSNDHIIKILEIMDYNIYSSSKKQQDCQHEYFTWKCSKCSLIIGERDPKRMIEIIKKHSAPKNITEQIL